jgi:nitrite reductase/ring-hydroxylating ferredoxin subunit
MDGSRRFLTWPFGGTMDRPGNGRIFRLEDLPPCAGGLSRRGFCKVAGAGLVALGVPACTSNNPEFLKGPPGPTQDGSPTMNPADLSTRAPDLGVGPTRDQGLGSPDLASRDATQPNADLSQGGRDLSQGGGSRDLSQGGADLSQGGADLSQPPPDLRSADLGRPAADLAQNTGCAVGGVAAGTAAGVAVNSAHHYVTTLAEFFVCRDNLGLYALTSVCTHAGCTVNATTTPSFNCPCHGSTFDYNGGNLLGPATTPLEHYALCVDRSGNIFVYPNQIVSPSTRVA